MDDFDLGPLTTGLYLDIDLADPFVCDPGALPGPVARRSDGQGDEQRHCRARHHDPSAGSCLSSRLCVGPPEIPCPSWHPV